MNILLFGKTGQVGWELQRALAPLGNLIALDVHSTDYCGDFSNLKVWLKPSKKFALMLLLMLRLIPQ